MDLLFLDLETWTKQKENINSIWGVDFSYNKEMWTWFSFLINKSDYKYHSYDDFIEDFNNIVSKYKYIVGHNIIHHDFDHLAKERKIDLNLFLNKKVIDTLYLQTLIFIERPYNHLVKDYKLVNKTNNPLEDSKECSKIFWECINKFNEIEQEHKNVLYNLLKDKVEFKDFFNFYIESSWTLEEYSDEVLISKLNKVFSTYVNDWFDISKYLNWIRMELAYVYRLLYKKSQDEPDFSVFTKYINRNLPNISRIIDDMKLHRKYDLLERLQFYYWKDFKSFREYTSTSWAKISQWQLIQKALEWENILAILATWGGKSLTFQLPALINSELWSLSLIISPLQSLMKDQVDSLNQTDIQNVWYLNGLLSPLERKKVLNYIENWWIDLLYLSPEMLRSPTIFEILKWRNIDRIIIDEAHCFSKWWHDFRPDYMFIWDFIQELWKENHSIYDTKAWKYKVKISCFTATAKREVIKEIISYFREKLDINLKLFYSTVKRPNLHYEVLKFNNEEEKKAKLIDIIRDEILNWEEDQSCIVFARTRKKTKNLSEFINKTFWKEVSLFYHGNLEIDEKRRIQNRFMAKWEKRIIVATNAFWMGIDKNNVRYVIHYEIPESLENYTQEAWRAWRDGKDSKCIIFYNEKDIDENFRLQKRSEITRPQVKKLVKAMTQKMNDFYDKNTDPHRKFMTSVIDLIDASGWINRKEEPERREEEKSIYENKIKTAIYLLENRGFIKRKFNHTRVFATSRHVDSALDWFKIIQESTLFESDYEKEKASEILKQILNGWIICVEEIPEKIWITKKQVKSIIYSLQKLWLIKKENDISWFLNINKDITSSKHLLEVTKMINNIFAIISKRYVDVNSPIEFDRHEINTILSKQLQKNTLIEEINDVLNFIKNLRTIDSAEKKSEEESLANQYAELEHNKKIEDKNINQGKYLTLRKNRLTFHKSLTDTKRKINQILELSQYVIDYCNSISGSNNQSWNNYKYFELSMMKCISEITGSNRVNINLKDLEEVLIFLHRMWIIKIQSWLFMFWTSFIFEKWERFWTRFLNEDYERFQDYYQWKIKQVHYMQEYALKLADWPHEEAEEYLEDYFYHDNADFEEKYFKWRFEKIKRPMTENRYIKLIKELSEEQRKVVENNRDNELIIAWPWAWKTKTLVHKVASLILNEWVRPDEFLLLSFSRAAKFELKKRVLDLLGSEWYWLDINTFHGYSYKILWKEYKEKSDNDVVIKDAIEYINKLDSLPYSVIVLDEFQDINDLQYDLVKAIKEKSSKAEEMRIIATWDDDQNIYEFQWWNVKHIRNFEEDYNAKTYVLTKNYRSTQDIINISSSFIEPCKWRIKQWKQLISARWEWSIMDIKKVIAYDCDNYTNDINKYVNDILSRMGDNETLWILSYTNEQVLKVAHILKEAWHKNIKLALRWLWYPLEKTLEFYEFLEWLDKINEITKEKIEEKYEFVKEKYWNNRNVTNLRLAIDEFLRIYKKVYKSDVYDYFYWIKENDLWEKSRITVSTLHQSKGKEFDNVIILFDDQYPWNDNEDIDYMRRLLYVWITRAKTNLLVIWNKKIRFFSDLWKIIPNKDEKDLESKYEWSFVDLTTTLGDVYLWFNHEFDLNNNYYPIWTDLEYNKEWLFLDWEQIIKFSRNFIIKMQWYQKKWYEITWAKISQRIVYQLTDKETGERSTVVIYLATINLEK